VDPSNELDQALAKLIADHAVEVREDGRRLPGLDDAHYEVRPGVKPTLHLWSDERTLVRRVTRIVEANGERLRLEVERFGRKRPGRLEIVRRERARAPAQLGRESYAERLAGLLTRQFPDEKLESLTTAADLEHSLSGSYARGQLRRGQQAWAVLGVAPGESAATIDGSLTFGLIWLEHVRGRAAAPVVAGLRLILPAGSSRLVAHRLGALAPDVAVELYEWEADEPLARRRDPADAGNVKTWLTPRRQTDLLLGQVGGIDARIRALAPEAIDAVVVPGTRQVGWRFRGLEFARWSRGEMRCGVGSRREKVTGENWDKLERLVCELAERRRPDGEHRDPLYRGARERWLETLVLAEPTRIEPRLEPETVYAQVPAFSASDRGVLDLLGVTKEGRLAVIELKADEDLQLVFQAVDYWLRVRWHQRQGDFARYGYFPGKALQEEPPLLYLVAPGLRFHPVTRLLLRYLSTEIPVCRIGLNEDWRQGLRVIEREWQPAAKGAPTKQAAGKLSRKN
jgi:hypothetical protein